MSRVEKDRAYGECRRRTATVKCVGILRRRGFDAVKVLLKGTSRPRRRLKQQVLLAFHASLPDRTRLSLLLVRPSFSGFPYAVNRFREFRTLEELLARVTFRRARPRIK